MKLRILLFDGRGVISDNLDVFTKQLEAGALFKFVFKLSVNLDDETIIFNLAIAAPPMEHFTIIDRLHSQLKGKTPIIELGNLGGGYLEMKDGCLVFCRSSSKFGPYKVELLKKVEEAIKTFFGVTEVKYLTDCA